MLGRPPDRNGLGWVSYGLCCLPSPPPTCFYPSRGGPQSSARTVSQRQPLPLQLPPPLRPPLPGGLGPPQSSSENHSCVHGVASAGQWIVLCGSPWICLGPGNLTELKGGGGSLLRTGRGCRVSHGPSRRLHTSPILIIPTWQMRSPRPSQSRQTVETRVKLSSVFPLLSTRFSQQGGRYSRRFTH